MPKLFLSYRRADCPDTVKLIVERLRPRLRDWKIFYDQDSVEPGGDFTEEYRNKVVAAEVVLVVIGPSWLQELLDRRARRVDHVREEVTLALTSGNKVIPVTVMNAAVPTEEDLADFPALFKLAVKNGRELRPDRSFDASLEDLASYLEGIGPPEGLESVLAGKYNLVKELGSGGFGIVYRARQAEPEREVAVKLIKLGMDSKENLARFYAEAQALAMMGHDNIARLFDFGVTAHNRPFLVMEFVDGESITNYCTKNRLSLGDRLGLFRRVCLAVQHAHDNGVIHRDIKPDNVLVTAKDGIPKVIDFGLAKAIGRPLTNKPLVSERGLVGTLLYASPEQAAGRARIDERTDVYSLGVLLYELLVGKPPIREEKLRDASELAMRNEIIKGVSSKPSAELSSSKDLPAIAEKYRLEPAELTRLVHGDLDKIVMHALRKDPGDRYATAELFASDIGRYLNNEPISVEPRSFAREAREFVQKYKLQASAAAVCILILAIATVVSWVFYGRANHQADAARRAESRAEKDRDAALEARRQADIERDKVVVQKRRGDMALYSDSLRTAQRQWDAGRIDRALDALEACPPALRGIEYRLLFDSFRDNQAILVGHSSRVTSVAFRPDGRRVVSADEEGTIKVWDALVGDELYSLPETGGPVGYTPDGRRIVVTPKKEFGAFPLLRETGPVALLDAETGRQTLVLTGSIGPFAMDPDGTRIAAVAEPAEDGDPAVLKVWDASTGKELFALKGHKSEVSCLAFSPDGKRLVSGGQERPVLGLPRRLDSELAELKVWDLEARRPLFTVPHEQDVTRVAFSPDGRRIAVFDSELGDRVFLLDAATGKQIGSKSAPGKARGVAFTPDARRFVVACEGEYQGIGRGMTRFRNNRLEIWNTSGGEPTILKGHASAITCVAVSPDGGRVVSGSEDRTVRIWGLPPKRFSPLTLDLNARAWSKPRAQLKVRVCLSRDGQRLVSVGNDRIVRLWDTRTGEVIRAFPGSGVDVRVLEFSKDGRRVLATSESRSRGGTLTVWDTETGKRVLDIALGKKDTVYSAAISPDGRTIATNESASPKDREVVVRDVETGDVKFALPGQQFFFAGMAFSPDGKKIATGDSDSAVRLWDASTGKLLQTFPRRYGIVSRLSFSPEGDRLGTATGAGTVRYDRSLTVWDLSRGNEVFDLPLHNNDIRAIEFTPDGRRILSCSVDKTLSICDAATGQFLLSLPLGDSSTRFAILPEQRGLALLTERNAVEFRDATRGREPFVLIPDERVPKSVPFERVAFSDDGNELLTLDSDEMVHGWNPATGASLPEKPRTMPPGAGTSAVSADGRIRARVVRGLVRVEPLPEIVEDAKRSRRLLSQWAEVDAAFHSRAAVESLSKADWFAARWHLSAWLKTQPAAVE